MTIYHRLNGVTMKPGTPVYVCDREDYNYDGGGTIVSVESGRYIVQFGEARETRREYSIDQIMPLDTDTEEAREWRASRQLKVFLCHGSEDKPAVRELQRLLCEADMQPWLDEIDIKPGQEWDHAIRDAVNGCHIVLVILSSRSVTKEGYVQKEIRFALERAEEMPEDRVYIIPALIEPCPIPRRLSKWQAVSLFAEGGRERLVAQLRELANARFNQ
jgi:TIR domain